MVVEFPRSQSPRSSHGSDRQVSERLMSRYDWQARRWARKTSGQPLTPVHGRVGVPCQTATAPCAPRLCGLTAGDTRQRGSLTARQRCVSSARRTRTDTAHAERGHGRSAAVEADGLPARWGRVASQCVTGSYRPLRKHDRCGVGGVRGVVGVNTCLPLAASEEAGPYLNGAGSFIRQRLEEHPAVGPCRARFRVRSHDTNSLVMPSSRRHTARWWSLRHERTQTVNIETTCT
jgi:hypothetical protein